MQEFIPTALGITPIRIGVLLVIVLTALGGCSDRGDFDRHSPSLVSRTYAKALGSIRQFAGEREDYDLPFTAAEDAMRNRVADLLSIRRSGVISQSIRARNGDGYMHIAAITEDIRVERQRFADFVEAARKTMQIDDARAARLAGLDALTARRQASLARERRRQNDRLIRDGVRSMRARSRQYDRIIRRLPVEWPEVPLQEIRNAHEELHEDVVRFHGEIDRHAHMRLGRVAQNAFK